MKTRLRKRMVAGRQYVWRGEIREVRGERHWHRCIRVRVFGAGKNSRALQVDLLSKTWTKEWFSYVDEAYPTPADLRAIIERGLALGWDPDAVGGTFLLTEADHTGWELPRFLITDRLRDPAAADPTARVIRAAGG